MKKIKSQEDLKEICTCDIQLESIKWVKDGRDIELIFISSENVKCKFTCTWASDLKTSLKTEPNEGGYPLTWNIILNEKDNKRLGVMFDFASKGCFNLCCNELIYNKN